MIQKSFKTPLGIVVCGLECGNNTELIDKGEYPNGYFEIYKSPSYEIELIEFKIKTPLYNGDLLTDSYGCIWRIRKTSLSSDPIRLCCTLKEDSAKLDYDIATGEHLDAIEISNQDWIINIGTEDDEVLKARAEKNDWMPKRFSKLIGNRQSFTDLKPNGLITSIPLLDVDEKIHIQYLVAFDKKIADKVNTWIAVDQYIRDLEDWIGIKDQE